MTKRATKINAARLLHLCGWSPQEIASVTASRTADVQKWIEEPDYVARRSTRTHGHQPCANCGSTDRRLRNNGLCDPCIEARDDTIMDMRANGFSRRDIAVAVDLTTPAVNAIIKRRRDSVRPSLL